MNEIPIDKVYSVTSQGEKVFVGIRQDTVTLLELRCGEYGTTCNCSCSGILNEFMPVTYDVCDEISISVIHGSPPVSGVCVKAKIICSIDSLICRFKEQFSEVYKYAEALQYMKQGMVTDRRNWQVENLDVYRLKEITIPATEKMFYMTLGNVVKSLKQLWMSSICFVCDPNETGEHIEGSIV